MRMRKFAFALLVIGLTAFAGCAVAANSSPPDGCVYQMPQTATLQVSLAPSYTLSAPAMLPFEVSIVADLVLVATVPEYSQELGGILSEGFSVPVDHVPVMISTSGLLSYTTTPAALQMLKIPPGGT